MKEATEIERDNLAPELDWTIEYRITAEHYEQRIRELAAELDGVHGTELPGTVRREAGDVREQLHDLADMMADEAHYAGMRESTIRERIKSQFNDDG